MIRDPNKGIDILFDYNNRPYKVTWDNGNTIEWLYDGAGLKLQQLVKRNGVEISILDYIGEGIEYQMDTLETIYLGDAKLTFNKGVIGDYLYFLKDHLGNNRIVFSDNGSGVAGLVNEAHFYPYGGLMSGNWQTDKRTKRLFNGIEKVSGFGLNVYHAKFRTLDQWTGRWWQIDPEVEQFYSLTPYNSNFNNPVRFSDPDGDNPILGIIAGAALDIGFQVFVEGKDFSDVDFTEVAFSAATGAVGLGIVSKLNKIRKVKSAGKVFDKVVKRAKDTKDGKFPRVNTRDNPEKVFDKMKRAKDVKNVQSRKGGKVEIIETKKGDKFIKRPQKTEKTGGIKVNKTIEKQNSKGKPIEKLRFKDKNKNP